MNEQIALDEFEQQQVIREFQARRQKITRAAVFGAVAVALILVSPHYFGVDPRTGRAALMLIVFAVALWIHLRVWRCPHCGGHPGKLYLGLPEPFYCPQCGVQLAEHGSSSGR